jgi:hypothetical protein
VVRRIAPAAGRRVARGSVVTVSVSSGGVAGSSPGVPVGRLPSYLVPDFTGHLASTAPSWLRGKTLSFTAYLGPLRAGNASSLFANYVVTRQAPAPDDGIPQEATLG